MYFTLIAHLSSDQPHVKSSVATWPVATILDSADIVHLTCPVEVTVKSSREPRLALGNPGEEDRG